MQLRECDIVMKGGITSGVVYPMAVSELAASFRFRNVGGTSAGAIAAAATAAAEYGRGREGAGFDRLARLPRTLAADGRLFALFQPQPGTRDLFSIFTAGLAPGGRLARAARVLAASWWAYAEWIITGSLPGLLSLFAVLVGLHGRGRGVVVAASVLLALLGGIAALAARVIRDVTHELPANNFGACRGYDPSEPAPGLVSWLDAELDALAGNAPGAPPLTFGDLWGPAGDDGELREDERRINLQMITTNLTHGRPYTLPFVDDVFWFDPVELAAYFPPRIVVWMVEHARRRDDGTVSEQRTADGRVVLGLPVARDLPVLVATRLSLSFPFLISAVPLYAVDYGRPDVRSRTHVEAERCWFSDGGITSNFPVHFFDSLLPRRPTFGINLLPFTRFYPRAAEESDNIYMPRTNGDGRAEWWTRIDEDTGSGAPRGGAARLAAFAAAIVDAAREWRDNAQTRAPGYRDRVVHVKLDAGEEGGLNLTMSPEVIDRLTARGHAAGALLRSRYTELSTDPKVTVSWPNHRWVRYRSAMAALERSLDEMREVYREPAAGDDSYAELVERPHSPGWGAYRWTRDQRNAGPDRETERLLQVLDRWEEDGMHFGTRAPKPAAELRGAPKF